MHKFAKGHKKYGGRKKGGKNKAKFGLELLDLATSMGIHPFEQVLYVATGNWKKLGYKTGFVQRYTAAGYSYKEDRIQLDHRLAASIAACNYIWPKKKSTEHSLDDETKETLADFVARVSKKK